MESFFQVKKPDEVFKIVEQFGPSGEEAVPFEASLDRVLSRDVVAEEDLPEFSRSAMDGYALRAKDTFGAGESLPAMVEVCGEVLMGQESDLVVDEGRAARISTGGMLPEGANGVVMVEYCNLLDETTLEVSRAISPLENVIQRGDDLRQGETVLEKGHRCRPQDLGLLAGLGILQVSVYKRPKIGIISTGDEIVSIDEIPRPGQVRDINRYTLEALCRQAGGEPVFIGLSPDDFESLRGMVERGLAQADMLWISGGSSVGIRDLTLKVFEVFPGFELLVHGISISPGKPTIIGRSGLKPIIGLPGHAASALVVAKIFLTPLILRLSGYAGFPGEFQARVEARLARNIESASGREDYVRVKLVEREGGLTAEPVLGKSGLISTLVEGNGLIRIDMNTEGLYEGQDIEVRLF